MMVWRDAGCSLVRRAATVLAAALFLASCGGGEQVTKFVPFRVLAFGDETSIIKPDGSKYTVNFVSSATATPPNTPDCNQQPIWVQVVANGYSVPFPQCPGTITSEARSRILATENATVAAVSSQVDTFLASSEGPFRSDDLVTILVGQHDIWSIYQSTLTGGVSSDQAVAQAEQAGTNAAGIVNRVAQAGAKVLISTVPNQNVTPDGRTDTSGLLLLLSQRFNAKLRTGLVNDGRMIGLVLFDESVTAIVNSGSYNTTDKACDDLHVGNNLPTCNTNTLRTITDSTGTAVTASPSTWLWADGTHVTPLGHTTLGSLAFTRAANNPF
jgi:hypothetical protein